MEKLEERAERYEQKYRNERKKTGWMAQNLKAVKQKLCDMTSSHNCSQHLLQEVQAQLDKKDQEEKGVITEVSRAMMRDLVSLGVKANSVNVAVGCIAGHLGTKIEGKFTRRSTCRAVIEGRVASSMPIAEEIKSGKEITISSDGTTHRNINYESRFMNITNENGDHKTCFLSISTATHHTSKEQLEGWVKVVQLILDIFNTSPRAQTLGKIEFQEVLTLLKDAEDQKKLVWLVKALKEAYEHEGRGEDELLSMSMVELMPILLKVGQRTVECAGGPDLWNTLSKEEQDACMHESCQVLYREYGQKQFETLSEDKKCSMDLFLWAGCCMHKELNSVKGKNA
ncbi:hypothetical protein L208DRAFT_1529449 [Tricholoma matsutake]|nr:hypothetical protein L208DRAFT_1529449 [Tricholoma matsutake 945]